MVSIWTDTRARSCQHSGLVFFHLYHTSSWSANEVCHRYYLFYLVNINLGDPSKLCMSFGYHDPSSGKPLGRFQVLICKNTKYNGLCINISQKWNKFSKYQATQACSMAWQIKVFLLSYYKELQNSPNWIIVFKQWQTVANKPVAGLGCFIGTAWWLRVILCTHILFIPPRR